MSDVDEQLNEIRERHRKDARWHCGPSMICPQSHEDRAFLLNEITSLRSRVEKLEKVRAAARFLINEDAGVDDPAEDGWWEWEKNCEALRAALKEAKP